MWRRVGEVVLVVAVCAAVIGVCAALAWLTKFPPLYD